MIEGEPATVGHSVTHAIYVVDVASGKAANGVVLFRYLKTDSIDSTTGNDTVTVELTNTVPLSLIGNANASCRVAGTTNYLYIGTDQDCAVVKVTKGVFSVAEAIGGGSTAYKLKYITANEYGWVSVGFSVLGSSSDSLSVFAPNGQGFEGGGGDALILTPYTGISNTTSSP